jgi:hypothetical protein
MCHERERRRQESGSSPPITWWSRWKEEALWWDRLRRFFGIGRAREAVTTPGAEEGLPRTPDESAWKIRPGLKPPLTSDEVTHKARPGPEPPLTSDEVTHKARPGPEPPFAQKEALPTKKPSTSKDDPGSEQDPST